MKASTINAINKRLHNGENRFYIGAYFYECNVNGMIRRRKQCAGFAPSTDWERVGNWNPAKWEIVE